MRFLDRRDAGRRLGERLSHLGVERPVVLGVPRGGVPVAFCVAQALHAPLDVIVVRKLGVPFQPELAMGAIGEHGVRVLEPSVIQAAGITEAELVAVELRERAELERRVARFRAGRPSVPLETGTAVVVDDGVATGSTAKAACRVVGALGAAGVVFAAPVASGQGAFELATVADQVVVLETPDPFLAVGQWYVDFSETSDDEVRTLLTAATGI